MRPRTAVVLLSALSLCLVPPPRWVRPLTPSAIAAGAPPPAFVTSRLAQTYSLRPCSSTHGS